MARPSNANPRRQEKSPEHPCHRAGRCRRPPVTAPVIPSFSSSGEVLLWRGMARSDPAPPLISHRLCALIRATVMPLQLGSRGDHPDSGLSAARTGDPSDQDPGLTRFAATVRNPALLVLFFIWLISLLSLTRILVYGRSNFWLLPCPGHGEMQRASEMRPMHYIVDHVNASGAAIISPGAAHSLQWSRFVPLSIPSCVNCITVHVSILYLTVLGHQL